MRFKRAGNTHIGEIVVVAILMLFVIAIVVPMLGMWRRNSRMQQNNIQVRDIQGRMILFAGGNNNFYPGLKGDQTLTSFQTPVGWCQGKTDGQDPAQRLAILLLHNFFPGEYVISPAEAKSIWTRGTVSSANYSYAMLELPSPPIAPPTGATPTRIPGRLNEWGHTINMEAPVLSDRSIVLDPTLPAASIWARKGDTTPSQWQGSVAWNDNHVTFEKSSVMGTTRIGAVTNTSDDLFTATGYDDAYMIYSK